MGDGDLLFASLMYWQFRNGAQSLIIDMTDPKYRVSNLQRQDTILQNDELEC